MLTDSLISMVDKLTYCEATQALPLGQPTNIISSLAFLYVIYVLRDQLSRVRYKAPETRLMAVLTGLIAVGSIAWHSTMTGWGFLLDVTPIVLLLMIFLVGVMQRMFKMSWIKTGLFLGIFVYISVWTNSQWPDDWVAGTGGFIPTFVFLILGSLWLTYHRSRYAYSIAIAAFSFGGAILFRVIDLYVCDATVIGTHFLWHGLSALTIFYALKVYITIASKRRSALLEMLR